jgi:hypothetical protein
MPDEAAGLWVDRSVKACDFYKQVKQEEAHQFVLSAVLLSKLRGM